MAKTNKGAAPDTNKDIMVGRWVPIVIGATAGCLANMVARAVLGAVPPQLPAYCAVAGGLMGGLAAYAARIPIRVVGGVAASVFSGVLGAIHIAVNTLDQPNASGRPVKIAASMAVSAGIGYVAGEKTVAALQQCYQQLPTLRVKKATRQGSIIVRQEPSLASVR